MHFIIAGCSHTNGSEIEEPWHPGTPEKAYGAYVARKFNATYENISGPGWSNRWIFSKLYQRLEPLTEEERKNTFVLIGWTSGNRIPIWHPIWDKPYHLCPTMSRLHTSVKKYHRLYYKTSIPHEEFKNYEHGLIVGIQGLLNQFNISYVMHWAVHPIIPTKYSSNLINQKNFFNYNDYDETYWNVWRQKYWDKSDRWQYHAPESYHKIFANKLITFIDQQKLL